MMRVCFLLQTDPLEASSWRYTRYQTIRLSMLGTVKEVTESILLIPLCQKNESL
jgi:hypothetical protein